MEKILEFDPSIHSDISVRHVFVSRTALSSVDLHSNQPVPQVTYGEEASSERPAHAYVSDYFLKRKQFAEDKDVT